MSEQSAYPRIREAVRRELAAGSNDAGSPALTTVLLCILVPSIVGLALAVVLHLYWGLRG